MISWLIGVIAFLIKELGEVLRQPRLIASLVLGPSIVLLLFGVGLQSQRPIVRTGVVTAEWQDQAALDALLQAVRTNFDLVAVSADGADMRRRLQRGELDLIQVLPPEPRDRLMSGAQSNIEFVSNVIDPQAEAWIRYLAYAETNEINRAVLIEQAKLFQSEASGVQAQLADARTTLTSLERSTSPESVGRVRQAVQTLRESSGLLLLGSPLLAQAAGSPEEAARYRQEATQLRTDLTELERALSEGRVEEARARIGAVRGRIEGLERLVEQVRRVPPEVLVSPLAQSYTNLRGQAYSLVTYFAPGVLALIIQHIAVTLGALGIVRERLQGSMEMFQVAPVSAMQLLIGKYLGFTFFVGLIAAVLCLILFGLGVPPPLNPWLLAGVLLGLILGGLGLGFLISVAATTDSQAVQWAMLALLMSIFFGGFFLPLGNFIPFVRGVGYALPITHAIEGLHAVLLRGLPPGPWTWAGLIGIALVCFLLVTRLMRRQLRSQTFARPAARKAS